MKFDVYYVDAACQYPYYHVLRDHTPCGTFHVDVTREALLR